ncbi:Uncharacterised protein [Mycolicibacterium gilvum]|uniref:4Fe-4S Wbl-type domain-containing protein n=1 Tax=Mycolicibacterium gilvum TaxID=1804 RepID=A0A378SKF7_9MYCO|nr:Uncharacterised protein [Mycolicibacterium gilvum]
MSHHPTDLFAAQRGAPSLPGARCRGKPHLFDEAASDESEDVVAQRHSQALGLCRLCPALASCATWFDELPKSKRPPGVVAGRLNPQKAGRPRKTA